MVESGRRFLKFWRVVRNRQAPRSLTVFGPYRGSSGHDHLVRQFVRHLNAAGVRLALEEMRGWGSLELPDDRKDGWYDAFGTKCRSSCVLHFCMPHQVRLRSGLLNVNYTMFESNRICSLWARHSRTHDLVVVPTESSRQAWLAAGFPPDRVTTCPLGVDPGLFHPRVEPLALCDDSGRDVSTYRTRFLNVSEFMPRKNLSALLRVWIRATSRLDNTLLILKLSTHAGGWLAFKQNLTAVERELGKTLSEAAPLLFFGSVLSEAEMPRLFASATHYWSMSCGEGWDLPMTEAAATGLRLVSPEHSAYATYLDGSVARMIPVRLVPVQPSPGMPVGRFFENSEWWQPDEDAAAAHISEIVRTGGEADPTARERIVSRFTWQESTRRLISILQDLHDRHGVVF